MSLLDLAKNRLFLLFCAILFVIDLVFPVTLTFDSGHYFRYVEIFAGDSPLHTWDPVRGVVFPGFLYLTMLALGKNQFSLLFPMSIAHLALFLSLSFLAIDGCKIAGKRNQNLVIFCVFALIAIDPLVIGYYHTVLTEFFAATIAAFACVAAYLYYKSPGSRRDNLLSFGFFCIAVPFAWHLKQPYVGTAAFPILIASLLILVREPNRKTFFRVAAGNISVFVFLGLSIWCWNLILPDTGYSTAKERKIDWFYMEMVDANRKLLEQSPGTFLKHHGINYLAQANFVDYDTINRVVSLNFSFPKANENRVIAYRMYNEYGNTNVFPLPDELRKNVEPYITQYFPSVLISGWLRTISYCSSAAFSVLYILLPLAFLVLLVLKITWYKNSDELAIGLICAGSALLNAAAHAIMDNPIDRYLFWGYPLLMFCTVVLLIGLFRFSAKIFTVRLKHSLSTPAGAD